MKRLLPLVVLLLGLSLSSAVKAQTPSLTIWVDNSRTPVFTELSKQFTADFGVDVTVTAMPLDTTKSTLIDGASTGEGPDIFSVPHDNIGQLIDSGVVAPIDLGDKVDSFLPNTIAGFSYNGKLYGVPYALENIGFFRNTDLVPDAPKTWDEVAAVGKELVDAGNADFTIAFGDMAYNYFPVYTAFGGYIFGRDADGNYTADDLGVDSEGMVAGADWGSQLIKDGYASNNLNNDAAYILFQEGKVPFIMTGPWALAQIRDSGVPYAISAFPAATEDGEPGAPFIGIQGLMVKASSENLLLAQTYLTDFIATEASQQAIYDSILRSSAWKSVNEAVTDPDQKGFAEAGTNGQAMPAIPEMGQVWTPWINAGTLIAAGEQSPTEALDTAAEQIRTGIEEAQ